MERTFWLEDAGITAIEYGLIGVLILVAALTALTRTGHAVSNNIWEIIAAMTTII